MLFKLEYAWKLKIYRNMNGWLEGFTSCPTVFRLFPNNGDYGLCATILLKISDRVLLFSHLTDPKNAPIS